MFIKLAKSYCLHVCTWTWYNIVSISGISVKDITITITITYWFCDLTYSMFPEVPHFNIFEYSLSVLSKTFLRTEKQQQKIYFVPKRVS